MTDYSQHGEQQIILNYFGDFVGTLLSIGENDGITFSNARALLEKGWYGILVEPSEKTFKELEKNCGHFNAQLHNVAISDHVGEVEFFESGSLIGKGDHSLVSSIVEAETERWKQKSKPEDPIVDFTKTTVPCVDVATLIKNTTCTTFEFITIDTEGMDLEILKQLDLEALGCRLICVEYNNKDAEEFDRLIPFPLLYKNRTNLIYGRKKV